MKPKGSVFARLLVLVLLVLGGSLPVGRTAHSFDPDEPSTPVGLIEKVDFGRDGFPGSGKGVGKRGGKVESVLRDLIDEQAKAGPEVALERVGKVGLKTKQDGVLVVVEGAEGAAERLKDLLESRGGLVASSSADLVQAFLPLQAIDDIAALPEVERVRRPHVPTLDYTSEGLGVINAPAWQAASVNGSGVKIGIIDAGFYNYNSLLGTELPPADRVHVQSFFPGGDITGGGERHGTACAEIIYDIAPAAHFYLANIYSDVDFGNAVDWMIANGVNVLSVSLGWMGANNYDGAGFLANKVNAARAAGIFWANSAGNQAKRHWEGSFSDPNGNGFHNFSGADEGNTIYATAGSVIFGALTWNDSWSSPTSDYDLLLARSGTYELVAVSAEVQGPGVPPSEIVYWPVNQTGYYFFAIGRDSGPTRYLELYTAKQDLEYQIASSSLVAPADAAGAVAVGAFYFGSGFAENFSSQGPTNDGRVKPDLAAPDGVSTYSYYGSGYGPFYGTSAAAPHVAGAAALAKQVNLSYTPAQIQSFLEGRAIDTGSPGKDNVYGWGKLNLGSPPPPKLSLSNTSLYFMADPLWDPPARQVFIQNGGGYSLTWTAQEWNGASYNYPWLSISPANGTAPSTLQVSVDKSLVVSGTVVAGQIRIDGASASGSTQDTPQYVNVTFRYSDHPLSWLYLPVVMKVYAGGW